MTGVPTAVAAIAAGMPIAVAWTNELGGVTFEIGGGERRFVKWSPAASPVDLDRERARLQWAIRYATVPAVLDHGRDADGAWLVTRALPGSNAVTARWRTRPAIAAAAIGEGLRRLHDALPIAACPFTWPIDARLADIRRRAALGTIRPARSTDLDLAHAIHTLARPPSIDRLVVCHGDACAPNTLIDDDGRCCGHVDLGALGTADRWADLAVATWSTEWNYGPGWEAALLDGYGVPGDDDRIGYYRLLWELGP